MSFKVINSFLKFIQKKKTLNHQEVFLLINDIIAQFRIVLKFPEKFNIYRFISYYHLRVIFFEFKQNTFVHSFIPDTIDDCTEQLRTLLRNRSHQQASIRPTLNRQSGKS